MRIAIWGATGHVGQAMYHEVKRRGFECRGYARDMEKASRLLEDGEYSSFNDFPSRKYDILINAIAAGTTSDGALFETLERWDWRMIDYARDNPTCACVSVSSGAVYGGAFSSPAVKETCFSLSPNKIEPGQRYGLVKLLCEQRHRSFSYLPLVDIRLFAFFTRYMDLNQPFFMSDVIKAICNQAPLMTRPSDFVRDFAHPEDFLNLILLCADKRLNGCFDLYSRAPIKKSEIIALFTESYGLKTEYGGSWISVTGAKSNYFSRNYAAAEIGYEPRHSSKDVIISEAGLMIEKYLAEENI
jgi:nucleoside-diphosphate-sugar epimerase